MLKFLVLNCDKLLTNAFWQTNNIFPQNSLSLAGR
jgi:hypothetical protein